MAVAINCAKCNIYGPSYRETPPLVVLPLLLLQLMRLPCGRHPLPVRMYGLMYGGGQNMLRR